jgi:DNA-directed RNA polymerase subunit beta
MTPRGTFVINGAERVVVSQLHRSPGVFFGQSVHPNGTKIYSARVIPFKGAWMEFATDINNVMYAYIDRKKEIPCNHVAYVPLDSKQIKTFWNYLEWQMK